jgi:hypothetical protein
MTEQIRLGIVGSAGTGKSTLGVLLSNSLGVPFLASKTITLDILSRDGYDHGCGIQVEKFLSQEGRQDAILKKTISDHKRCDSFVTDRTVIDLAAYSIAEMHSSDPKKVSSLVETCRTNVGRYTHLVFCPWGKTPLKANDRRTLNSWYQFIIHSIDFSLMGSWGLKFLTLDSVDEKKRVAEVVKFIGL